MLYYGDSAAGGARASEWVAELHNAEDLRKFVNAQSDKVRGWWAGGAGRCTCWQQLACTCALVALHVP